MQLLDDEQGILRISVGGLLGGPLDGVDANYLVFRGDPAKCLWMLERAAHALRDRLTLRVGGGGTSIAT
jgi:hypothetical protein